jgi:hypothetical protein
VNDLQKHLKSLKKDRAKKRLPNISKKSKYAEKNLNPEEFKKLEEQVKIKFPDLFVKIILKLFI